MQGSSRPEDHACGINWDWQLETNQAHQAPLKKYQKIMGNLPESIQLFLHVLALGWPNPRLHPTSSRAKSLPASRKAEVLATDREWPRYVEHMISDVSSMYAMYALINPSSSSIRSVICLWLIHVNSCLLKKPTDLHDTLSLLRMSPWTLYVELSQPPKLYFYLEPQRLASSSLWQF
jgi:hypothetical protein